MKIRKEIVEKIHAVTEVEELRDYLQNAVELEHATIPVYLTGLLSIKPGRNQQVREIIHSVVVEEMLHMSIACNVLNAIGGSPQINKKDFVPTFPGPLPMRVGEDRGLVATLAPLSKEQIDTVYMAIEEPDDLPHYPVKQVKIEPMVMKRIAEEYATIGEFYQAIIKKINDLGEDIFTGDPGRQMVNHSWFPKDELWPVTNVETAQKALALIVKQGEGTTGSPMDPEDPEHQPAHYFRFAEVFYGSRLVKDSSKEGCYSYTGDPIEFDPEGIYNLRENAKATDYPVGSVARRYADQTNYTYSSLLNKLHQVFNGKPELIDQAMGMMYELRLTVQKMVTIQLDDDKYAAPPFQYVGLNR